jgi:hypothetical protein
MFRNISGCGYASREAIHPQRRVSFLNKRLLVANLPRA